MKFCWGGVFNAIKKKNIVFYRPSKKAIKKIVYAREWLVSLWQIANTIFFVLLLVTFIYMSRYSIRVARSFRARRLTIYLRSTNQWCGLCFSSILFIIITIIIFCFRAHTFQHAKNTFIRINVYCNFSRVVVVVGAMVAAIKRRTHTHWCSPSRKGFPHFFYYFQYLFCPRGKQKFFAPQKCKFPIAITPPKKKLFFLLHTHTHTLAFPADLTKKLLRPSIVKAKILLFFVKRNKIINKGA